MPFKLEERLLPEREVVASQTFDTLEDALREADISLYVGPRAIEVTIVDQDGKEHFNRVFDHANRA